MKILDWLDRVFVTAAMGILVVMMCLTTISVFGRYFFGAPIPDDLILSEHLMVFLVFLPLGAVQAARQHVFVTIFTEWMSNETKVVMETIGVMVGFFAVYWLARIGIDGEQGMSFGVDPMSWMPLFSISRITLFA